MSNHWFAGKELAFAVSIGTGTHGLGEAICSYVIPVLYEQTHSLTIPTFFPGFMCVISGLAAIVMIIWDRADEKRRKAYSAAISSDSEKDSDLDAEERISIKDSTLR